MAQFDKFKFPIKLALSMVLFYALALYMNWDLPKYGAIAIVVISMDTTGASLQKGLVRVLGTTVGLIFGLLFLSFFFQDRWGFMISYSIYVVICMYLLQGSRYAYAWQMASFVPIAIWSSSYGDPQYVFDYAIYRSLETVSGVIIYTLVDTLLWPKRAKFKLFGLSSSIATDIHSLYNTFKEGIDKDALEQESYDLEAKISGSLPQQKVTLQQALTDTSNLNFQKKVWEDLLLNTKTQYGGLVLLLQNNTEFSDLDEAGKSWLKEALEKVNLQLIQIDSYWGKIKDANADSPLENGGRFLRIEKSKYKDNLSRHEKMILSNIQHQLSIVEQTSLKIVKHLKVICGEEKMSEFETDLLLQKLYKPSLLDVEKLKASLFPSIAFCVGFIFWVLVNPILGTSIPEMMLILGLQQVTNHVTPKVYIKVLKLLLSAMFFVVAPIYFFIMPHLSTAIELYILLFAFTFLSALVSEKVSVLKVVLMMSFVNMTSISNVQSYSFYGLADGATMMIIVVSFLAILLYLINSRTNEANFRADIRKYIIAYEAYINGADLSSGGSFAKGFYRRKGYFDSVLSPVPKHLNASMKGLNYKKFPENSSDKVKKLVSSIININIKIENLELINLRYQDQMNDIYNILGELPNQFQNQLFKIVSVWKDDFFALDKNKVQYDLKKLRLNIDQKIEDWEGSDVALKSNTELTLALYATVGSMRALVGAMGVSDESIREINWESWNVKQF